MKAFSCIGEWWVPGNNNTFKGSLSFEPEEGIMLKVFGDLKALDFPENEKTQLPFQQQLLNGEVLIGEKIQEITLTGNINSVNSNLELDSGKKNPFFLKMHVPIAILGACFPSISSLIFQKIIISFACPFFNDIKTFTQEEIPIGKHRVVFELFKNINNTFQEIRVKITLTNSYNLDECIQIIEEMWYFLTILFTSRISILAIRAEQKEFGAVNIFFSYPACYEYSSYPIMQNYPLSIFNEKIVTLLNKYYNKTKEINTILRLYTSSVYNIRFKYLGNLEHQFISLFTALEAYHSIYCRNDELSSKKNNENYNKFIEIIKPLVDQKEEMKKVLKEVKDCLKYKSLNDKLQDIYQYHKEIFGFFEFLNNKNRKNFFKRIIDLRSDIAHGRYNDTSQNQELFENNIRLKMMIEACLLHDYGLSMADIKGILESRGFLQGFNFFK